MRKEIIFHIAILSHIVMGLGVIIGGEPASWATAVASSLKTVQAIGAPTWFLGVAYIGSSILVIIEMLRGKIDWIALLCYAPQQYFMLVSGFGAVIAMWTSSFADGVVRPRPFIISDQHLWLVIGIAHTIALIDKFTVLFNWRWRKEK